MRADVKDGIINADHRRRFVKSSLAYAKWLNEAYGYDKIRGLERDELRSMVKSDAYYGGTLDLGAGHIHPLEYALGLARMAAAAGARIHEQSRVLKIEKSDPARVTTDSAEITADHVLLACNGYHGDIDDALSESVMPINNYIVATAPLSDAQRAAVMPTDHAVADSKFVVNYFRFSDDNRLLFGGTESYGYRFPDDIAAQVRRPLRHIFPALAEVPIDYAWGGVLGITMNRLPHIARLRGNVLACSGYSGSGVALGTLSGQIAAEAIAGQAERFDVFARLPTEPFPGGRRFRSALLVLAMTWFTLRDRI